MINFKNNLLKLTESIQFRTESNEFLNKLTEDLQIKCLYLLIKDKIITK